MSAQATWISEVPEVENRASLEIDDATSTVALDSDELPGMGFSRIIGKALLYGAYSTWCGSWRRPTPRY